MGASEWSVAWWKERHDNSYFPGMDWHKDWKVCPYPPPNVVPLLAPKSGDVVLEIGCGYGEWMVPLFKAVGCRICGIDVHDTLAVKAAEKFAEYGCGGCEFRMCDGLSIPYPNDWFDKAYSISVFQHIPRATVRRYFKECSRTLKPGGEVLFHFREADGKGPYSRDIDVDHEGDFSVGWSKDEVRREAERLGWEVLAVLSDGIGSLFLRAKLPPTE